MKYTYHFIFMAFALLLMTACGGSQKGQSTDSVNNDVNKLTAKVNAPSGLTLRAKPNSDSKQVALLDDKSEVEILDKNGPAETIEGKKGNWYKIKAKGDEGYVFSAFLKLKGQENESEGSQEAEQKSKKKEIDLSKFTRPANEKEAYVAAPSGIRLRSKPDVGSEEVIIAPYDAKLEVVENIDIQQKPKCIGGMIGRWIKVKYQGKEGYVVNAFVRMYAGSSRPLEMEVATPSGVTLRDKPSKDGKQVTLAPEGAMLELVNDCATLDRSKTVTIGEHTGTWIQVKYKGKVGYVFNVFLMPIMT
ncbi:SH3 domain-containing protein [Microscilla marina]|uniref:Lipoprotein, putative n=1 Tax=Microscilla marina ATCC 23134 TaxID=313606 RepID=A1ZHP8_MICM2|nr:SH3 domain-containing protein [Microscilla marina]EAY30055.1 lipoprotein, putative [Microscilla marina ATCC 23134]